MERRGIIAIDDDSVTRKVITEMLSREGFDVTALPDGLTALENIENHKPDILLLDIMMPETNGLQVLETVRSKYNSLELPVIMISARIEDSNIIAALKLGANDYVVKPVNFDILKARINTQLKLKDLSIENKINKDAVKSNRAKTEFLASVSDELKSPMQGVINFSRLGSKNVSSVPQDTIEYYFDAIYSSGMKLLQVLNDLVDISKIELGRVEYRKSKADIMGIVEAALDELKNLIKEKRICINLSRLEKSIMVDVDVDKMSMVLHNLLFLSVKESEDSSTIRVVVKEDQIERKNGPVEAIRVSLIDESQPLSDDDRDQIFYNYSSSTAKAKGEIESMGLAFARAYVQGHDGEVWSEPSPDGDGNVYNILLPVTSKVL